MIAVHGILIVNDIRRDVPRLPHLMRSGGQELNVPTTDPNEVGYPPKSVEEISVALEMELSF